MKHTEKRAAFTSPMGVLAAIIFGIFLASAPVVAQEQGAEKEEERTTEADVKTENEAFGDTQTDAQEEGSPTAEQLEPETESGQAQPEPQPQSDTGDEQEAIGPGMNRSGALNSADLSDEQLQAFVNSANKVMEIHEEAEEKMVQTIEAHNLDVETFNKILQARQMEQVPEAEPEQVEAFQKAFPEVLNEQQAVNAKIEQSLQEEGLDVETYENIMIAYQQDPQIQQRVSELIQKIENKD